MKLAAGILALLVAFGSLGPSVAQTSEAAAASHARAQDELRARTAEFSRAIVAASAGGWSSDAVARIADFYAEDTVVFPPRGEPLRGRPALTTYWSRTPDRRILTHAAVAERIDVDGDLATEWGRLSITSQQGDAAPAQGHATYISIWTRENGVWRKQMDTWW